MVFETVESQSKFTTNECFGVSDGAGIIDDGVAVTVISNSVIIGTIWERSFMYLANYSDEMGWLVNYVTSAHWGIPWVLGIYRFSSRQQFQ